MTTTFTCPNGHESTDPEWCDTCGAKLGAAPTAAPSAGVAGGDPGSAPSADPGATPTGTGTIPSTGAVDCPHCGTPNEPGALFCEGCGYDFTTGQAPPTTEESEAVEGTSGPAGEAPEGWVMVVEIDPGWYHLKGELADQALPSPSSSTVPLTTNTVLIGRTSQSRNLHPEIALDGDTGVSRRHAQLVHSTEGTWTIVDLGSSNGTYVVAGEETPD
ncbi:MAG: FHA domain-containing protein, partial [Ilumatobacteraceae bacterium]